LAANALRADAVSGRGRDLPVLPAGLQGRTSGHEGVDGGLAFRNDPDVDIVALGDHISRFTSCGPVPGRAFFFRFWGILL